jgi:branched-chain amino acid transport system ATP-binding protein
LKIELRHIKKSFGANQVLEDISFEMAQEKVYVLMGTNGSGKTTLFNILTGFLEPENGIILFNSENILNNEPYLINAKGISRTFQDLRLIEELSVKENVMLSFKNQEGEKWWKALLPKNNYKTEQTENINRTNEILRETFISEVSDQKAGEISYGQQKLLTLACCIANNADLFLLDEPVAGVNPIFREKLITVINKLKEKGKTFIIIEHNADFISEIADTILFLNTGIIKEYESYSAMRNDEQVKEAFV